MTRITDRLFDVEGKLDKDLSHLSRRLILREFAEAVAAEARKEGYHDGMRDVLDAKSAEEQAARQESGDE